MKKSSETTKLKIRAQTLCIITMNVTFITAQTVIDYINRGNVILDLVVIHESSHYN
jgi:hypothetical protein